MPLQLPTSQLRATVLSLHTALWNLTAIHLLSSWRSFPFCHLQTLAQIHFLWEVACDEPWLTLTTRTHHPDDQGLQHPNSSVILGLVVIISWVCLLHIPFYWVWKGFRRLVRVRKGSCCFGPQQIFSGFCRYAPRGSCQGAAARHPWETRFCKWELSLESL